MLWTLIRKEMLQNMTSLKFVLTLLLVTAVFIVSGFVFLGRYKQEVEDFRAKTNESLSGLRDSAKNLSHVASYVQTIQRQPKTTQVVCEGFEKSLPNVFKVDVFSIQNPEIVGKSNFLFPRFADIDWAFIISLILSFVAFILTFDSISAEKERGTLSLIMSNSVPRDKVILAKYISAMFMLMIPLFIGLLLNLIIVNLSGLSSIGSSQWLKILAFLGISILYLSVFVLLGILVSSRSARSSSSIAILLFIWVVITMIIPSFGRIAAERFISAPNRPEVERRIQEAGREIWDNSERYGKNAGNWGGDPHEDWVNPPARARLFNAITDARNRINEDYINKMIAQVSLGRNVTCISPTVIYQRSSEAIIGTGVARFRNLYNQLKRYKEILKDFVVDTDRRDAESFHLLAEGRQHQVLLSQKPVDYNAIPMFSEIDISMGSALKDALWDVGALALLNILLFMAVYISFLRYDVR
jgi:ABC-type transport system involved in multi-copper enzyme maturation permease subunit